MHDGIEEVGQDDVGACDCFHVFTELLLADDDNRHTTSDTDVIRYHHSVLT